MNDLGDLVGVELGDLEAQLLHIHVVLMAIAAWFVLWAIRRMWKTMDENEWVRKLKPLYPTVLCQGFVWIPGILPGATTGDRILLAVWAGILASIGYQIIRRFVKKVGVELPEDPNKLGENEAAADDADDDTDDDADDDADEDRDTPPETPAPKKAARDKEPDKNTGDDVA
jgi:hypothetical protein